MINQLNKIDSMDYQSMLELWRFAEIGHPYFTGEIGDYFAQSMSRKKSELDSGECSAISKAIGWGTEKGN
jgi:hypothetical protein